MFCARVISSRVLIVCFFTIFGLDALLVEELSSENVASRSFRSNWREIVLKSFHTVASREGVDNLFQKKGFRRLLGRVIFITFPPFHADGATGGGGGGGIPLDRGGGGGT